MRIEEATSSTVADLWAGVEPRIQYSKYLEEAAQALTTTLHNRFRESVVLARVFVTVPFDELPATNRRLVRKLAASARAESELKATTPILSLIGTHGQEEAWNDRRKSKGHAGIPLISSSFVDSIPMISRLLKELGVPVDWGDSHDSEIIINTIGSVAGLFFVEKAATATDHQGRKIIAAQDFVSTHHVGSVFGTGGAYSRGDIIVIIVFCRDVFSRSVAERFLALVNLFVSKTTSLVGCMRIFSADTGRRHTRGC
jgi:histone H3/H4